MPDHNRRDYQAIGLLLILSLIWGTSFILIKQGLKVFAPDEVAALRVSAASLFLLPVALIKLKELQKKDFPLILVSGLLGIFIPSFLFAYAQTKLDSSVAGILNTLSPLWTMVLGAIFFGQRFKGYAIIGIIIGFAGTIVLAISRAGGTLGGFNSYALFIVLACAFYGANLNWVKYKIHNIPSLTITSVSVLLIGPLAIVYLLGISDFTAKIGQVEGAWRAFGFVVLLGCMSTSIATALFNQLIKISTPLFASSVTYIMPIVAVMWGVLDGEQLIIGHFIGMVCILGGVYLANRK
ncbi:MAG: EamA family transporter [Azospira oryzae]|nr:MAG: EamA family transporter [Azospira oryzae]